MSKALEVHTARPEIEEQALVCVAIDCDPDIGVERFLAAAAGDARFLWRSPNDAVVLAASGIATEITGWGEARFAQVEAAAQDLFASLSPDSSGQPKLFGGFAFREDFVPDLAWADFSPAHFVLPHFQYEKTAAGARLSMNVQIAPHEITPAVLAELQALLTVKLEQLRTQPDDNSSDTPPAPRLTYLVDQREWTDMLNRALTPLRSGTLDKIVLARTAQVDAAHGVDSIDIDRALRALNAAYPDTYRFLLEPAPGRAFFGASPELLLRAHKHSLETMALAGSAPRGGDAASDAVFAERLLASSKDRYEHQVVIDAIDIRLREAGLRDIEIGETGVLALRNIQHLHTPVRATRDTSHSTLRLAELLHPTPALGGLPRERALPIISELEPVSRGWYAAPVGWIDAAHEGEFAVAIRSAVAQGSRAWLYAGAGIVAASEPDSEWRETALKFVPMLRALGAA